MSSRNPLALAPALVLALSAAFAPVCLSACATSVPGGMDQSDRVDATPIGLADARVFADAQPQQPADAAVSSGPDAGGTVEATVTASCLFVRTGPGTGNAKVPCTDSGAWCNADNDVCIPMGDTATVVGASQAGLGCDAEWFPIEYRIYQGYACGSFLAFPTSAASFLPPNHETLFPSVAQGPQG